MFKKLSFILVSALTFIGLVPNPVSAHFNKTNQIIKIQVPQLSDEEKALLKQEKDLLKKKYIENWKEKTPQEKQKALQEYKKELDKFCQEKFGMSYHELKTKYHHYFKPHLPS